MEETQRKIEQVSRSEFRRIHKNHNHNHDNDNGYESCDSSDENFMLLCTSPVSQASTITMDLLLSPSSMSDSVNVTDDLSLPEFPGLQAAPTDKAMIGTVGGGTDTTGTSLPATSPTGSDKGPTVFMDDDSFTYVTLAESKSSDSGDVFNGIASGAAVNDARAAAATTSNTALQTPYRSAIHTPHTSSSMQTPYTYETIESSDVINRTGFTSQFTFETINTSDKENTPNLRSSTRKNKRERIDLTQSPLEGRRIYSMSPIPNSALPGTPQDKKKEMQTVDLDCFSIDDYASSPDKSEDCFSIDSYSTSDDDDGLGFGGTGMTSVDLARTRRDQSLFRLRSMGGGKFHSMRPLPVSSPQSSSCGAGISQRKHHVEKQRRRLSQVVQSYCQSMES